jgi:hypothetical protein
MKIYQFKSCIILLGLLLINDPVFSHGKFEISAGIGWPDATNLKIKYGKNIQVGASLGFLQGNKYVGAILVCPIAELYYHFGGKSKITEQPPWYLYGGLGFSPFLLFGEDIFFCPRLGRSFNFSKRIGINFDAGAFIPFFNFFYNIPIFPSGSVSFFIRL